MASEQLIEAIRGEIEPVRVSPMYGLGMSLVALGMILLPLVYLALIAAVAFATYYHATHSHVIFAGARGRIARGAMLAYLGPLAIGAILIFFMVKPLFAGRGRRQKPFRLRREDQPALFAYVERLCQAVHSPPPREICVDCDVNASAGFRQGAWSMFGNDLTLTIGLPLAAGMNLRQLSGILAHEFGHFSQGFGMRLTYVIRTISGWFVRVVYERDTWDEQLDAWARGEWTWLTLVLQLARFFVWLTRRILWVLMWIGHAISGFMMRQMEFDADRHETRLVGSDAFESSSQRLIELSIARKMALGDLKRFYAEGRLADDFQRLMLANVEQIPPEVRKDVLSRDLESRTGLMDTHPSTRDRIANSRRENTTGIYRCPAGSNIEGEIPSPGEGAADMSATERDFPATDLFHDFSRVSQDVTLEFYRNALERDIQPRELNRSDDLLNRRAIEIDAGKALKRYFQGCASALRPLHLPRDVVSVPVSVDDAAAALRRARDQMLAERDRYRAAFRRFDDADTVAFEALRADAAFEIGAKFDHKRLALKFSTIDEARIAGHEAQQVMTGQLGDLKAFESAVLSRLSAALRLASSAGFRDRMEGGEELVERARRLVDAVVLIHESNGLLWELRDQYCALAVLFGCAQGNEKSEKLIAAIRSRASRLHGKLVELRDALRGAPYPFEHAEPDMTLGRFVLSDGGKADLPDPERFGDVYSVGEQVVSKMVTLHMRLLAHLALLAERIETHLGFEPFPEPKEDGGAEVSLDGSNAS
jgi:Zn-dependent protease with chaperone function